ncbi:hypothetical protein IAQ61_004492 [Plenodomus lingam]|uniref:uncharacterized protein n=1 Tax=Leptosphaeria maculans TaxID=5022 RepID=UPI00332A004C|nr:hypothetical protein IAQ61_004492 [Plenodomus lingam]
MRLLCASPPKRTLKPGVWFCYLPDKAKRPCGSPFGLENFDQVIIPGSRDFGREPQLSSLFKNDDYTELCDH